MLLDDEVVVMLLHLIAFDPGKASCSKSFWNIARPISPRSRRTSRKPIAPSTSSNWSRQEVSKFSRRWTPQLTEELSGQLETALPVGALPHKLGLEGRRKGVSRATASRPHIMALGTCSAAMIPPLPRSVTSSRHQASTKVL